MQKIDRLGWAEAFTFEAYGARIGVRASKPGHLERLLPHLPPRWSPLDPGKRLGNLYSWVVGGERRPGMRTFDLMYSGSGRIARTLKPEELFDTFAADLRLSMAVLSRSFVFVHAGVVGWKGRAIVTPGRTFTGKSTLVQALVRAGAEYLSDEFAILDRRGCVHPFAQPIQMRPAGGGRQEPIEIASLGGHVCERPLKVGAIVSTHYRDGARSRFRRVSEGEGILTLMANAVPARLDPARVLLTTRRAAQGALVLRGNRGDAENTAAIVLEMAAGQDWFGKRGGEDGTKERSLFGKAQGAQAEALN